MPSLPAVPQPTAKEAKVKQTSAAATKHFLKTKTKTTKNRRRFIPIHKDYIMDQEPTQFDVVSGRGGRSNHHAGNRRYWMQVLGFRHTYKLCDTAVKKEEIAKAIVDSIRALPGRFLQLEEGSKRWFVQPDRVALDKVKQALRDKHFPSWAKNIRVEQHTLESFMKVSKESKTRSRTIIAAATVMPNNIVKNSDDLKDAIESLPSFKDQKENFFKFSVGHSLDLNPLHFFRAETFECSLDNDQFFRSVRTLDLNKTVDDILNRLDHSSSSLIGSSGTDWGAMYAAALQPV